LLRAAGDNVSSELAGWSVIIWPLSIVQYRYWFCGLRKDYGPDSSADHQAKKDRNWQSFVLALLQVSDDFGKPVNAFDFIQRILE
jgi:hypothetical protein